MHSTDPGHVGIKGKERADSLACRAPMVNGKAMDRTDKLNATRDTCRDEAVGS